MAREQRAVVVLRRSFLTAKLPNGITKPFRHRTGILRLRALGKDNELLSPWVLNVGQALVPGRIELEDWRKYWIED